MYQQDVFEHHHYYNGISINKFGRSDLIGWPYQEESAIWPYTDLSSNPLITCMQLIKDCFKEIVNLDNQNSSFIWAFSSDKLSNISNVVQITWHWRDQLVFPRILLWHLRSWLSTLSGRMAWCCHLASNSSSPSHKWQILSLSMLAVKHNRDFRRMFVHQE